MGFSIAAYKGHEIAPFGEKLYDIHAQCGGYLFECANSGIAVY